MLGEEIKQEGGVWLNESRADPGKPQPGLYEADPGDLPWPYMTG